MVVAGRQIVGPILSDIFPPPPRATRSAGLTRPVIESRTQSRHVSSTDTTSLLSQVTQISTEISSASITSSGVPSSITTSEIPTPTISTTPSSTTAAPIEPTQPPPDLSPVTVTAITTQGPSPSIQAAPSNSNGNNGFLQNKVLSGVVFAVVGVVVLVVLLVVATIAIRRSRRRRLVEEAVSFDPTAMGGTELDRASVEKRRFSLLSSDHGHGGSNNSHGSGFGAASGTGTYMPPQAAYPLHDPYHYPGTTDNQYSFGGNPQSRYGGATSNDPYGGYLPQSNFGPAYAYHHERDLSQRSGTPPGVSSRARSPDGLPYNQMGQLKIANA